MRMTSTDGRPLLDVGPSIIENNLLIPELKDNELDSLFTHLKEPDKDELPWKQVKPKIECGRLGNQIYKRIYGGKLVRPHEYPWMALIRYRNVINPSRCGGSIINNYYVLTAAHCVANKVISDLAVYLGVHDYKRRLYSQARMYKVSEIFVHPDHHFHITNRNKTYPTRDISLIKLNKEITFNNFIRPICLPHSGDDFSSHNATIAGWGFTENEKYASFLKQAIVEVLTNMQCYEQIQKRLEDNEVQPGVLCTYNSTSQSCQGDSGSPLMVTVGENIMVQIGLVSFGVQCPESHKTHTFQITPTFFTNVSAYVNWIFSITSDAVYCWDPLYHINEDDLKRNQSKKTHNAYRRNLACI